MNKNLINLNLQELENVLLSLDEKKFRAKQLFEWFYKKGIIDINSISSLSTELKNKILRNFKIKIPQIFQVAESKSDGSHKFLLKTYDKKLIESILMIKENKATICISCMIGCPLKCKFCATGSDLNFTRKLDHSEIIGQIIAIKNYAIKNNITKNITNIVFMGMGEPLLNIENVSKAIETLLSPHGFAMSKSRITVSTAGIVDGLSNFINKYKVKLAISLHFPTDELRSKFMSINKKYPLNALISEARKINLLKREFITIEYLMLDEINDTLDHAKQLVKLLSSLKTKINLIPYNPIKSFSAKSSTQKQIDLFAKYLRSKSVMVTVRKSMGTDISGGCGQFALKE